MSAPTTWKPPASGGTDAGVSASYGTYVNHAGSYWFAIQQDSSTSAIEVRVASTPSGAWTAATMPSAPIGYSGIQASSYHSGVQYDGTDYAFVIGYYNGSAWKWRIVHATDPTGSWTAYEFDATDLYQPSIGGLIYADGTWVLVGSYLTASPQPGFIATSSTADGTYTFYSATSETGYDTATLTGGGTRYFDITTIAYSGSRWVTGADTNSGPAYLRTSTALTSGWAAPSSPPTLTSCTQMQYHSNGWWTFTRGNAAVWTTSDPTTSWTEITAATLGAENVLGNIVYGNGYWIVACSYLTAPTEDAVRISYLATTGSPDGTYTYADATGFFDSAGVDTYGQDVAFANGAFVASATYEGELRYWSTGPTCLRQRQSPVRAPSRVSGLDIRTRQTPIITR